jgi:integrase
LARPRASVPTYRLHRPTGRAVVTVYDTAGNPRDVYLGKHGSPESRSRYARLCAELRPGCVYVEPSDDTTVVELSTAYWGYAESYHGPGEVRSIRTALRALTATHAETPAGEFGPVALRGVRDHMVSLGWSRSHVNAQVRRIVRAFKWAAGEELVPVGVYQALKTLAPLRAGKTVAREGKARIPADPGHVAKTLPHLPPHVRALIEVIRHTGMRPGEACRMTLGAIDRTGTVWVYTVRRHKTAHRGLRRVVHLNAAAQAVITEHLSIVRGNGAVLGTKTTQGVGGQQVDSATELGPNERIFSPKRQEEVRRKALRDKRKTKVQPSQISRKKLAPKRAPGERYTPESVCRAVSKACKKAGVPVWSPYQLRHLVAAELRRAGWSLEHVRAALGHSHASMSAHYATGADAALAAEVAAG